MCKNGSFASSHFAELNANPLENIYKIHGQQSL